MVLPTTTTTGLPIPDFSGVPPFDTSPWVPTPPLTNTPPTAPGVPPTTTTTSPTPSSPSPSGPPPTRVSAGVGVKSKLLRPALTSHFYAVFNPPSRVRANYLDNGETISLLCTEASLPGSSILTNEVNDDYTGITERFGYRRQYDDRADFTFYVDQGTANGGYNTILLFEEWMRYVVNETSTAPDYNYTYRVNFPDDYRTEMFLTKFERDYLGSLQYTFVQAYPISISSMPVSYESSQLLKCTVSFTYNRYLVKRNGLTSESQQTEPSRPRVPGVPSTGPDGLYNPPGSPTGPGYGPDGLYNPPGSPTGPNYGEDGYFNIPGGRTGPLSGVNVSQVQRNYPNTTSRIRVSPKTTPQPPLPGTPRIIPQPIRAPYNKNAGTGALLNTVPENEIVEGLNSSTNSRNNTSARRTTNTTTTTNPNTGQGVSGPNIGLNL